MQFPDSWFEDEVRDGFYVPALMKRAWAAHLETLEDVARVCEKHQIRWFAAYGTMLGAVRHRGFIPWDDDMDISMLPDDYNRFVAIAEKELPGYYIPRDQGNDYRLYTSIWSSRGFCADKGYLEKYHGFPFVGGIDIFPLFYVPADPAEAAEHKRRIKAAYQAACLAEDKDRDPADIQKLISDVESLLHVRLDRDKSLKDQLFLLVKNLLFMYKKKDAAQMAHQDWFLIDWPRNYPIECFDTFISLPFETTSVPVPAGYDVMLKTVYHDYMRYYRGGSFHDYPYYNAYIARLKDAMQKSGITTRFIWEFSESDLNTEREKTLAEEFAQLAEQIHEDILTASRANDFGKARCLLEECQRTAIQVGLALERANGEGCAAVGHLEEYCEQIWQLHDILTREPAPLNGDITESLRALLHSVSESAKGRDASRREIVFVPCKASQWNSMEPAWQAAIARPDLDVYVIPSPYFYKRADGSAGKLLCEAEQFPDNVPVTDYNLYDFKNRRPDMIVIQNPYDAYNLTLSVHPFFYSENLKRYTDRLIYIPAFSLEESEFTDPRALKNLNYYIAMPALVHADETIVPSEAIRKGYIDILTNYAGETTRTIWEEKIICNSRIPFLKTR